MRSEPFYISRVYALFWITRICSTMSFQMLAVAVGWQIYEITNSALHLGFIGLASFAPSLFLVLISGQVADHFDRRHVIQISHVVEMLAAGTLAVACLEGWVSPLWIYSAVVVLGIGKSFSAPTLAALLPALVTREQLPRAVSGNSAALQTSIIAGPAVGGFLYYLNPEIAYGTGAFLFLLAIVLLGLLPKPPVYTKENQSKEDNSVFAGIRYIRKNPVVLGAISLDLFAVLLGGAVAILPIIAKDILHTGPEGLGLLRSAPAVGALLLAFWLARFPIERNVGKKMFIAVAIFGFATIALAYSTWFWLTMLILVLMGASDMISVVVRSSLIQLETPDEMRGRVSAVNYLFIGASNQLGEFRSGLNAAWLGLVPSIVIGGVGTLMVVALWIKWFPELAKRDKLVN